MDQWNIKATAWTTEKQPLDGNIFVAELAPEGDLWLTNDTNKEELKLSARATYDLMAFLQERAARIYDATHRPLESYAADEIRSHYTILAPTSAEEGERMPPPAETLYADADDSYLSHVFVIAEDWARDAYEGAARVGRIVPAATTEDTPERIPAFLLPHTLWTRFEGEADQSWKVTIWPLAGWRSSIVDHLYVHKIGDELVTGGTTSGYASARPRHLFLPLDEEDDDEGNEPLGFDQDGEGRR
jgi:hypothetical protein